MIASSDQTLQAIFTQLDTLKAMAASIDDATLSREIGQTLSNALDRYCEDKRSGLSATLANALAA